MRLLVNAGADFRLKYPYGPNSNGNLLDRVMSIAEEVTFCVPQVVEKATFLISKGLRPIKTLASDSNFSSPDFFIIASNFNIHCDKTIHFIDALKNRNYFESGELQTLCEELLTGKKQQIAAILECSTLPLDVCKLISSFTKPMRCQKDLKSVGFFKKSHHDHAPVTKNVHSYKPCVIS